MLSYKNKERSNPIMQTIAGRLSQEEIEALAAWFGSKPAPDAAK
jgi:cytochrome c